MPSSGLFTPPAVTNEPVRDYAPASPERAALERRIRELEGDRIEVPLRIGAELVPTDRVREVVMPHRRSHVLADAHQGGASQVEAAIGAALAAAPAWQAMSWEERAAIFLRAAAMLAGPWRDTLNAAAMLNQSKTIHQAEIDAAAELVDFWRFNVSYMARLYADQPISGSGMWNRMDFRPLEGFVFAVSPFNSVAAFGYLATTPALLGNTVVWKPSGSVAFAAEWVMRLLDEAGLPPGVVNVVQGPAAEIATAALSSRDLAGIHFTGSTEVFRSMWGLVGRNIGRYRNYPRIVGETGGKDFIVVHESANPDEVVTAVARGAFEYQGQKCSAPSRMYVPRRLWPTIRQRLLDEVATIRIGDVTADLSLFMGAVIDQPAFQRLDAALASARKMPDTSVLIGGSAEDRDGWFVDPTIIETTNPNSPLLSDELFGPIVTAFPYRESEYTDVLKLVDSTSPYALTGAIFARDRGAIRQAEDALRFAAGNFYINDKPTGSVVGQQPFGGARASGTNDKTGSPWNLLRWTSPRALKENFVPPQRYRYPYMGDERDGTGEPTATATTLMTR